MEPNEQLKKCRACGQVFPHSSFGNLKANKDGKTNYCRECFQIKRKKWPSYGTPLSKEQRRVRKAKYHQAHPEKKAAELARYRKKYRAYITLKKEEYKPIKNRRRREQRAERKFLAALIVANELNKK